MIRYYSLLICRTCLTLLLIAGFTITPLANAFAATPAKTLFGAKLLPAVLAPASHGFYTKGCLAGGMAIPHDGPTWQAMRPSRNRRWGHPNMIRLLERLSIDAKKVGWNGLMIGDISQPRGGPMLSGHASHQVGLDADIWWRPMPERRWSTQEREESSAISMLKKGSVHVNNRIWTKAHEGLLKTAAQYNQVQRIFVHPGIKKKLCNTVKGDRRWLNKIRPYWRHQYHFHIRLKCQPGSPGCKSQRSTGSSTGCGKSLDWWFNVAFAPKKKTKKKKVIKKKKKKKKTKKKVRRHKLMADLPQACRVVLNGPTPKSLASVTLKSVENLPTTALAEIIPAEVIPAEVISAEANSVVDNPAVATTSVSAITESTVISPAAKVANAIMSGSADQKQFTVPTPRPSR